MGNTFGSFTTNGKETVSLAASVTKGPFKIGASSLVGVRCTFSTTGTFDAVGTLAVKVGPSGTQSTVSFTDANGDTVSSKAVTAGDAATTFLFDNIVTAEGSLSVVWTRSSGGAADSVAFEVIEKDA